MKVLCVIPSLPEDLNPECVKSVLAQTLPVSMIVILSERVHGETLPEKISEALNRGLADLRMENYDYILRVDGDTILPENFLEENLKDNPDLCGKGGYAHIIKVKPFTEFFKGKFHKKNDDTYFNLKFRLLGLKVTDWKVPPKLTRQSGARHGLRYFWDRGILLYRMGFEPIHFLADIAQDIVAMYATSCVFSAILTPV